MKSKVVVIAATCLVASTAVRLQAQENRARVYAIEGLGALGGAACAAACGGAALAIGIATGYDPGGSFGGFDVPALIGGGVAVVSAVLLPAAAGYGAAKVGDRLGEYGSMGGAILGAYLGVGVGIYLVGPAAGQSNAVLIPACVLGGMAIPAGAVAGYNLGSPSYAGGGRLQLPAMALTSVELPDHSVEYGVKVQLAGLRF